MKRPHFASPEHIDGTIELDIRTDIYSLGVTFYLALTGSHPIFGDSIMQVLENHLNVMPPPVTSHNPEVSEEISNLIQTMLSKDRNHRPSLDDISYSLEMALVRAKKNPN